MHYVASSSNGGNNHSFRRIVGRSSGQVCPPKPILRPPPPPPLLPACTQLEHQIRYLGRVATQGSCPVAGLGSVPIAVPRLCPFNNQLSPSRPPAHSDCDESWFVIVITWGA